MTLPLGKSVYIWNVEACFSGDVERIATALANCGFQSAILHEAHLARWREPERIALVYALHDHGILPVGGAAVYGLDPAAEGREAAAICTELKLPAFVFDAETAWDARSAADSNAVKLLRTFKERAPGVLAGWCYWSFWRSSSGVSWHPRKKVIWAAMADGYGECDFFCPMMYWNPGTDAASAVAYLNESYNQYRNLTQKPIIPIGRAYNGDGGTATAEAVKAFDARARELGAPGVTWWSMEHALKLAGIWQALCELAPYGEIEQPQPEPEPEEPPVELTLEEKVQRLWDIHPELH